VGRQALPDEWSNLSGDITQDKCLRELGYVLDKIFCRSRKQMAIPGQDPTAVERHLIATSIALGSSDLGLGFTARTTDTRDAETINVVPRSERHTALATFCRWRVR
jgi:hypothetical protein